MFQRFVPQEFRPLLEYISPAAFGVIDWKNAIPQFGAISRRLMDPETVARHANDRLPVKVLPDATHLPPPPLSPSLGRKILEIYFAQLRNDEGTFLDLRLSHFYQDGQELVWSPSRLLHHFEPKFREGMLKIYRGYYGDQPELLLDGMLETGLLHKNTTPDVAKKTTALLFHHFGSPDEPEVLFSLNHFRDSFHALFLHLKRNQIRLPADFLFLGVYLVTLYWGLEKLGMPLNVKEAFEAAIAD